MRSNKPNNVPPSTTVTGRRRLYIMRHGHVDYFDPKLADFRSVNLSAEGQSQASSAGHALQDVIFDACFTSGLPRTEQTASLVLAQNHKGLSGVSKAIEKLEELRSGVFETESREELAARLAYTFDVADMPNATFLPGGEPFADAYARIVKGIEEVILHHDWKTALLVAHEGVNRLALGYICGAGLSGVKSFEQDLAGINIIDVDVVPDENSVPRIERMVLKLINATSYDTVKHALRKTSLEHLFDIDFNGNRPTGFPVF